MTLAIFCADDGRCADGPEPILIGHSASPTVRCAAVGSGATGTIHR